MKKIEKVLIVPDSFKNSLTAEEVAAELQSGFTYIKDNLNVETLPFADGGEGSLEVVKRFIDTKEISCYTFNPFMKAIRASYLLDESTNTAYIESARVIGLEILDRDPDCYHASSYGLGILISNALDRGAKEIVIFLGGSSTCDGGYGMAAALGFLFVNGKRSIERPIAKDILDINDIRHDYVHQKLKDCKFLIASDVNNPLYGIKGTAQVYARQKGANNEEIEILDKAMEKFASLIMDQSGVDIQNIKGAGAAGGLGAGGHFFLKGEIISGFEILSDLSGLESIISKSDFIVTGEGHIDKQSFDGKLISQIKKLADKYEVPVALICAIRSISQKEAQKLGFHEIKSLYKSSPKEINIPETKKKLFLTAKKWSEELTQ